MITQVTDTAFSKRISEVKHANNNTISGVIILYPVSGEARQGEAGGAEGGDRDQDPGDGEHAAVAGAGHHGQAGPPGHLPGEDSSKTTASRSRVLP